MDDANEPNQYTYNLKHGSMARPVFGPTMHKNDTPITACLLYDCTWHMNSMISSRSRAQTHLARLHSKRACLQESSPPNKEHPLSGLMFLRCRTSPVGMDSVAKCHRKIRIFDETLIFHSSHHSFCCTLVSDLPNMSSSQASGCLSALYQHFR